MQTDFEGVGCQSASLYLKKIRLPIMKDIQLTIQYTANSCLLVQLCELRKLIIELQIPFVS